MLLEFRLGIPLSLSLKRLPLETLNSRACLLLGNIKDCDSVTPRAHAGAKETSLDFIGSKEDEVNICHQKCDYFFEV